MKDRGLDDELELCLAFLFSSTRIVKPADRKEALESPPNALASEATRPTLVKHEADVTCVVDCCLRITDRGRSQLLELALDVLLVRPEMW